METHTFGDSEAAEILVELVEKHPSVKRKVSSYWNDYSYTMNEIARANMMDNAVRFNLADLFYHKMVKTVDKSDMPEVIQTYLKNIMVKKWRQIKESQF